MKNERVCYWLAIGMIFIAFPVLGFAAGLILAECQLCRCHVIMGATLAGVGLGFLSMGMIFHSTYKQLVSRGF